MIQVFSSLRICLYYLSFLFLTCKGWADLAQETIYLTWQQHPSTTMTIQWITSPQEKQSIVVYRPRKENLEWLKATGESFTFPQASNYLIHRVELKNLQPDREYTFKVLPYKDEYHFLTAPLKLEKELRFIVGGDMYHDDMKFMETTCLKAAQTRPAFALIGGDIAYAVDSMNSPIQKVERWIEWIKVWHAAMVTPEGNLIPVIAAIGNHDLIGQYDQTPAQAAVFSALFPMPGKRIYNVLDFNSYLSIFFLDSGHANPIAGQQTDWLCNGLEKRKHILHRFAIYHVPAYPSVRHFQTKQSAAIRHSWVPLFEKGGIHVAFEHHDHAYKRTHPLLKNRIHPQGVVYLGDGGWGVEKPRKIRTKRPYLAKFISVRHFIAVSLTSSQQNFKCMNDQGQTLDEYTKRLTIYPSTEEMKPLEVVEKK
jgi:hypothetical protein